MKIISENEAEMRMVVYGVFKTNHPEQILYVGKTEGVLSARVYGHNQASGNRNSRHYKSAILRSNRKYGDLLGVRVLGSAKSSDDLSNLEIRLIAEHGTFGTTHGLNMTSGGDGFQSGETNPTAKLTHEEVREIHQMASENLATYRDIADAYGVSAQVVTNIVSGRSYSNLMLPILPSRSSKWDRTGLNNPRGKLSDQDVVDIHKMYSDGGTTREIAEIYGIDRMTVSGIVAGRQRLHLKLGNASRGKVNPPSQVGDKNWGAKMTNETAMLAYWMVRGGETPMIVAERMGVKVAAINNLVTGKTWKSLGLEPLGLKVSQNRRTGRMESNLTIP